MSVVRVAASINIKALAATTRMRVKPGFLVAYPFVKAIIDQNRHQFGFRDWVMDSGAFSANATGKAIDVDAYIEDCRERLASDSALTEVFALDVIGDWKASIANAELSWKRGVPAIPTFHVGSPPEALEIIARDYPKIALGGAVGYRDRLAWAQKCFARVWPKPIHGFGFGHASVVLALPWHSVDSSSHAAPLRYGIWPSFGGGNLGYRQDKYPPCGMQVEFERGYIDLEAKAQAKWGKFLAQLNYTPLRSVP